jgi:two-component system LytT family response regulator
MDDEPLALQRLARMLEATGRVDVVGRATDPKHGLDQVAAAPVDVLFLDIQMPGLTGFDVAERLPAGPVIVFTTAYDHHAVKAFETNAIDYLLKPIERERLDKTLDRVARRRDDRGVPGPLGAAPGALGAAPGALGAAPAALGAAPGALGAAPGALRAAPGALGAAPGALGGVPAALGGVPAALRAVLEHLAEQLRGPAWLGHVASRLGDRVQLVGVDQVTHVVARHKATYAVTPTSEHMLDMTITDLETKLDPAKFIRIHRGTLVNIAWVSELHADFGGRLVIRLKDSRRTELGVSRDRVRALKERLGIA